MFSTVIEGLHIRCWNSSSNCIESLLLSGNFCQPLLDSKYLTFKNVFDPEINYFCFWILWWWTTGRKHWCTCTLFWRGSERLSIWTRYTMNFIILICANIHKKWLAHCFYVANNNTWLSILPAVTATLLSFVRLFTTAAHQENVKQAELEKKKVALYNWP